MSGFTFSALKPKFGPCPDSFTQKRQCTFRFTSAPIFVFATPFALFLASCSAGVHQNPDPQRSPSVQTASSDALGEKIAGIDMISEDDLTDAGIARDQIALVKTKSRAINICLASKKGYASLISEAVEKCLFNSRDFIDCANLSPLACSDLDTQIWQMYFQHYAKIVRTKIGSDDEVNRYLDLQIKISESFCNLESKLQDRSQAAYLSVIKQSCISRLIENAALDVRAII